jgi:hypothetical protein
MKTAPINFSGYDRTYNNAIDLVAQAAGYARATGRPIRSYLLSPGYYDLFRSGMEVLMKQALDPLAELTFEGIPVRRGGRAQFDNIVIDWHPGAGVQNPENLN